MTLPKPIKYAADEGGDWIKWKDRVYKSWHPKFGPRGIVAHTIVFDNGRAFDMLNGWRDGRKFKYDKKTGERIDGQKNHSRLARNKRRQTARLYAGD